MIILHFHLQPQFIYELFHINFTLLLLLLLLLFITITITITITIAIASAITIAIAIAIAFCYCYYYYYYYYYYYFWEHSHARNCKHAEKKNLRQLHKHHYYSLFRCFLYLVNIFSYCSSSVHGKEKKKFFSNIFSQNYLSRIFST